MPAPTDSQPHLPAASAGTGVRVGVFDRYTDHSRRAVVMARELARKLRHNFIGPEHLLLGLLNEDQGVAAQVLDSLEVGLEPARYLVAEMCVRGHRIPEGHIPFTRQTKNVILSTAREAEQLGHDYIGTEHLLLGLMDEDQTIAAQVLIKLGADLTCIRERVIHRLHAMGLVSSASCWQFLALPSAARTLALSSSFEPTGVGSVCFRPHRKRASGKPEGDIQEILRAADLTGSPLEVDSYGFTWITIRQPPSQFGSLINRLRTVNLEMADKGLDSQVLCSIVGFSSPGQNRLAIVYLSRRGTFYPFVPLAGERRDTVLELYVKRATERKLPIEDDLSLWHPVWGTPGL